MGEHNCHQKNDQECITLKACELWEKGGREPELGLLPK